MDKRNLLFTKSKEKGKAHMTIACKGMILSVVARSDTESLDWLYKQVVKQLDKRTICVKEIKND